MKSAAGEGSATPPEDPRGDDDARLRATLLSRGYLRLLVLCALIGIPVALACFAFLTAQHALQNVVWETLPEALGFDRAPWWWPLPALLLAGLILAPIVTRMPGRGGHVPVHGLGGPPLGPAALPSVVLAALATLPLGVVLGPEAPLMAIGGGLALLALRALRRAAEPDARGRMLLATAGSTAAISSIFGGPVVAAVLVVEGAGIGGAQLVVLLLPCLIAGGTGALVFTGFGSWTGLSIGALSLPEVPPDVTPDAGDFLWGVPAAVLIAAAVAVLRRLGRRTERWTAGHSGVRVVACGAAAGVLMTAYALLTGRSAEEAALSGQSALGGLAAAPHSWSVGALLALAVCKGLAWSICLGSMRGGPIFPAVFIGAALGIACAGLPGLGATPGLALGMASATAVVTGLPLTSAVLTVLLLGVDAHNQMPLIVIASVVGIVTAQLMRGRPPAAEPGTEPGAEPGARETGKPAGKRTADAAQEPGG
ncbi:chloride channel protein [Streptomyces cavernicola]|uniref:Chloride channel protein n=1 Tax=Streptomyces cavernicola TaxID=3043613 RepID=A0ABT6SDV9_9ACTN|nr:chloride channel protein [Streptomyces sp. B-S-A6]MDI3406024.1 chloride channel protein [Streptomyces sp. B-S-A6]